MAWVRVVATFVIALVAASGWLSPRLGDTGVSVLYLPLATLAVALTVRVTLAEAVGCCAAFAAAGICWAAISGQNLIGTTPFLIIDIAEAATLATILRWRRGRAFSLGRLEDIVRFVVATFLVSIAFGGLAALLAAASIENVVLTAYDPLRTWRDWAAGDIAAYFTLTAAALLLRHVGARRGGRIVARRPREFAMLAGLTLFAVCYDFQMLPALEHALLGAAGTEAGTRHPALLFLTFPAVIWLSASFGPMGAAASILLTVAPGLHLAHAGYGPVWIEAPADRALVMQAWVCVCALAALVVAALADLARRRERLRRRASALARRRAGERDDFLAAMNHELRTPLNGVIGFAELLGAEIGGPLSPLHRKFVDHLRISADRLLALVTRVQSLSLTRGDAIRIAAEPTPALALLAAARESVEPLARASGLTVTLDADPELRVLCDPAAVRLALGDVLLNAIRHSRAGGSIALSAQACGGGGVTLTVADDGAGFDPAEVMGRRDLTRGDDAAGLGLQLVDIVMCRHGGALQVRSAPGSGATVSLRFPASGPQTVPQDGLLDEPTSRV
ncbi:sensor histidine kinase [Rubrimonas cliftonensis]|uniref:histidine kinase n=1 Tax=Rubrimonas cliftonensis TaxID=89524 RepID=A0A1H4BF66_9RHOB|nr:HAMP domain-containing sensor histidine kinase [Rubrimonas cliftonensis]SEA46737.1 Signal transduction histidine kinase [Rubrimonas cliftonensis]